LKYSDPTVFFIVLPGWILSVCLHEFAHAYTAFRGGDLNEKEKGYLTLNPFKYTHPLYSLGMPILFMLMGGIGLPGGAVYIHRAALRSRIWDTAVSLAGPAMNLLIAALLSIVFHTGPFIASCSDAPSNGLAMLIQLQLSATLLNLLPVPPLDGYQAIHPWFSPRFAASFMKVSRYGFALIFIGLLFIPAFNHVFWGIVDGMLGVFGVDIKTANCGWDQFRFWKGNET